MKRKFIKGTLIALSLVTSVNLCIMQLAQAATSTTTSANVVVSSKSIPAHAKPGTRIKYDDSNNVIILSGKIDNSTSSDNSLPVPQPGMTVTYDGGGDPAFIKIDGENYSNSESNNDSSKKVTNSMSANYTSGYYENYGAISWFNDKTGQANHPLEDYDCATDKNADNCALGTIVYAADDDTNTWGSFEKWDIGNLQGQAEPRIVDVWDVSVFESVYNIANGEEQGLIHDGYYYHY